MTHAGLPALAPPAAAPEHHNIQASSDMATKEEWPELVGKPGQEAKQVIQTERPDLKVFDTQLAQPPTHPPHKKTCLPPLPSAPRLVGQRWLIVAPS